MTGGEKGRLHGNKSARKQSFDRSRESEGQRLAVIDWGSDSDHIKELPLKYSKNHPNSGGRSVVSNRKLIKWIKGTQILYES